MPLGHLVPTGAAPDPLAALWSARSVAVVGAVDRPGAIGRLPVEFLLRYGFRGRVVPVRPDGRPVCGVASVASVADAGPVDLALVMVSAARVPAAVEDCARAGVPVVVVCGSGFAETGAAGAVRQAELLRIARAGGIRLVGPNCIGSVGAATGQVTSFSPLFAGTGTDLVDGPLGFVSASGALGYGTVSLAYERGLGLGRVVTTGNEADVSAVEVMTAMATDPGCRGVLGYVESLTDLTALRALAATGVPVALLAAGRSAAGARAAASHTAALAAPDRVVDAALRQFGIVRVDDVDDLLDVGEVMTLPRPAGPRVAVVTTSGGSGILAADALAATGLELATLSAPTAAALDEIVPAFGSTANPVDVTASVMADRTLFDRALDVLLDDPAVDAVLATFCVLTGDAADAVVGALTRAAASTAKPVLAVRTGADHLAPGALPALRAAGVPCFPTPARAVRALSALHRFGVRERGRAAGGPATGLVESRAEAGPGARWPTPPPDATEPDLKTLLSAAGLPVPAGRLVTDPDDAVAAAGDLGGRVVVKAVVPDLVHKSDAGGVLLDVTPQTAAKAYATVAALGGGVRVEEQVGGGVEAFVGVSGSPLGPVLAVGVGGVLTEVLDDVGVRVLPVDRAEVERLVDETRLGRLLAGVRGGPPLDRAALVDLVLRVSAGVTGWPAGCELDLNPVTVLEHGVRILDAAFVPPRPGAAQRHHAIAG